MRKKTAFFVGILFLMTCVVGCGTMSNIEKEDEFGIAEEITLDLSEYNTVVVLDFENGVEFEADDDDAAEKMAIVDESCVRIANMIASEISKRGAYETILREPTDEKALVITGVVTRYEDGNAFLRFMIGLGAGSSYFDAEISLNDNETNEEIGLIMIDRNSWVLGGGIAAAQTVETYMKSAAEKVAEEVTAAKLGEDVPEDDD